MTDYKAIELLGLRIGALSRAEWVEELCNEISEVRRLGAPPRISGSLNGNALSLAASDPAFHALIARSDHIDADGMPIVLASRFLGAPIPERCATTDFYHDMARAAMRQGLTFYLLGGTPETIARALQRSREIYPDLKIVGARDGYFRPDQEDAVVADIVAARPDVLWVGMGVPLEQAFVARNAQRLTGVGLVKTCGGLFDFVSGKRSRAPRWMQKYCMEWLYRLGLEPRRLFKRYLKTNIHAAWLIGLAIVRMRFASAQRPIGLVRGPGE